MAAKESDAAREARWRAEMDANTLMAAQAIANDKRRMAAAKPIIQKTAQAANAIVKSKRGK